MSKGELLKSTDFLEYGEKYYIGDDLHYCDDEDLDFSGETVQAMLDELKLPKETEVRYYDTSCIKRNKLNLEIDF